MGPALQGAPYMKKKIAVILNTNQLGGAERSIIEQFAILKTEHDVTFFYPDLPQSEKTLIEFLAVKGFVDVSKFPYPDFLYRLSRKNYFKALLGIFFVSELILCFGMWGQLFKPFNIFYVNGNKAFMPFFAWSVVGQKKCQVFWHFRDFLSPRAFKQISRWLPFFTRDFRHQDYVLVGNSLAVESQLKQFFPYLKTICLYNLSGVSSPPIKNEHQIRTIGVASMFAPWKGIHSVLLMASLYESELRELGVERINLYGKDIYLTGRDETSYETELKLLAEKCRTTLANFAGIVEPKTIFQEIDLLIHPSLDPEPFGRVIFEAFASQVPVISTGLGGAAELIGDDERGLSFQLQDYAQMFAQIKTLITDENGRRDMVNRAYFYSQNTELEIIQKIKNLFSHN